MYLSDISCTIMKVSISLTGITPLTMYKIMHNSKGELVFLLMIDDDMLYIYQVS